MTAKVTESIRAAHLRRLRAARTAEGSRKKGMTLYNKEKTAKRPFGNMRNRSKRGFQYRNIQTKAWANGGSRISLSKGESIEDKQKTRSEGA